MKLSPEKIDVLIKFSENFAKISAFDDGSPKEARLKQVQSEWYAGVTTTFLPEIFRFTKKEIDASTGSSTFEPDEQIVENVSALLPDLLPEYHNHLPQDDYVKAIGNYFKQIGIIDKQTLLKQDVYKEAQDSDYFSMIGAGTTQLFTASLQSVIKTKGDVVIFAAPTYGLFLTPVMSAQGKIAALALTEKNHFKPQPNELKNLIQETHNDLKKGFLSTLSARSILLNSLFASVKEMEDSKLTMLQLINNVSKLLKMPDANFTAIDKACLDFNQALTDLLSSHYSENEAVNLFDMLQLPVCPRVRAYAHINPHMPLGTICNQAEVDQLANTLKNYNDIVVYDDLTYYDLVLPDTKTKPGSFARSPLKEKTLTLYSISKQFALAAARAGIALGPKFLIEPIAHHIFETTNSPNILTLNAVYNTMKWHKDSRVKYLNETLEEYALRRDFTLALIEGMDESHPRFDKIRILLSDMKISKVEQTELLKGISHLQTMLIPESGYFVILDFSAFKGRYLGSVQLNHSHDFRNAFQALANVNTIPGELMYEFDTPILRFAYSMEPKEILEGLLRIKSVLALMRKEPLNEKEVKSSKKVLNKKKDKKEESELVPTKEKQFKLKVHRTVLLTQFGNVRKNTRSRRIEPFQIGKDNEVKLPKASLNRARGKRKVIPRTY